MSQDLQDLKQLLHLALQVGDAPGKRMDLHLVGDCASRILCLADS